MTQNRSPLVPFSVAARIGLAVAFAAPALSAFAQSVPQGTLPLLERPPAQVPAGDRTLPRAPVAQPAPAPSPAVQAQPGAAADAAAQGTVQGSSAGTKPSGVARIAPKKPAPPPPEAKISQDPRATYHPDSVAMITRAAATYAGIAARGGWQSLPDGTALRPGEVNPAVVTLRQRLAAEGDAGGPDMQSEVYDPALVAAVKRSQARYGLPATGVIGPATVKALNVPAEERQRALAFSAQRLAVATFPFGPRHVVVNIPAAAVEAVENGAVVKRYVAVVGDPEHPSPMVEARIGAVNFNPTWTVPVSIIRKEIIPKMRKDPGYLSKQQIRVLDPSGVELDPAVIDWNSDRAVNYTLRQDPGAGNSLGAVRIAMPNPHAVYMHDTPSKRLFGRDFRFLSHGCVRVSGVLDLATWLLAPQGWTRAMVDAKVAVPDRSDVRLPQPVPVAWVYLTGFVTQDGAVHFRDDVYGLDRPGPAQDMTTATIAREVR